MTLRSLQARGLIRPHRQSRWVYYHPQPDPLIKNAAPLLTALRGKLLDKRVENGAIIRILTAFTHPRRVAIMAYLRERGATPLTELSQRLDISVPALYRHLRKLIARGLVLSCDDDGCFRLQLTKDALAGALLQQIGDN